MFYPEFFPTPDWLAQEMLSRINLHKFHSILEPSAGKGDLVEAIRSRTRHPRVACCELDPELQLIPNSKDVPILNDDFLGFMGQGYYFDLVVMNQPLYVDWPATGRGSEHRRCVARGLQGSLVPGGGEYFFQNAVF